MIGFAVRMRRFEDSCLFFDRVSTNRLSNDVIERAAERIAAFHQSIPSLAPRREYGSAPLFQSQLSAALDELDGAGVEVPSAVRSWCFSEPARLSDDIEERRRQGSVRECHGSSLQAIYPAAMPCDTTSALIRSWSNPASDFISSSRNCCRIG